MTDIETFAESGSGPARSTRRSPLVEKKLIAPQSSVGRQRPYRLTGAGRPRRCTELLKDMRRVATVGFEKTWEPASLDEAIGSGSRRGALGALYPALAARYGRRAESDFSLTAAGRPRVIADAPGTDVR